MWLVGQGLKRLYLRVRPYDALPDAVRLLIGRPSGTSWPDPIGWAVTAAAAGVTVWNSVPALAEMLLEVAGQRPEIAGTPIRAFLLSGDWISASLPDRAWAAWPDATIIAMGGATEASIWSNGYRVERVDPSWPSIPYGTPLRNQTMRVLDDRLEIRPPWAEGEIHIGGQSCHGHVDPRPAERDALVLEQRALAVALGQRPVGAHDPEPRHPRVVGDRQHGAREARRAGRDVAVGAHEARRDRADAREHPLGADRHDGRRAPGGHVLHRCA